MEHHSSDYINWWGRVYYNSKHVHCLLTHCSDTDGHPECPLQTGSNILSSCSHQMTSSHFNKTVWKRLSNRNGTWGPSNRTENMAAMTVPDTSRQLKFIIFTLKRGQFVLKGFKIGGSSSAVSRGPRHDVSHKAHSLLRASANGPMVSLHHEVRDRPSLLQSGQKYKEF